MTDVQRSDWLFEVSKAYDDMGMMGWVINGRERERPKQVLYIAILKAEEKPAVVEQGEWKYQRHFEIRILVYKDCR